MTGAGYGMIAQAAGGVMQSIASQMAAEKMRSAFKGEMQRQNRYRNEAFGKWQPHAETLGSEQATKDIAQGKSDRIAAYDDVGQNRFGQYDVATNPGMLQASLQGDARASLGGYSDYALRQLVRNIRLQDQLNRISNFSQGEASVFPLKMQDAQHSADKLAMWGQIIGSLGGAGSSFAQFNQAPQNPYGGNNTYVGSLGGIDDGGFGNQYEGQV